MISLSSVLVGVDALAEDHSAEGEPERAISHFVDRNGVDLVVMGTVARSGGRSTGAALSADKP